VLPDLAVLRFGVYDEGGKLLGQRILPLDGLQAGEHYCMLKFVNPSLHICIFLFSIGYRHISLRTEANFPMSLPMLFCNIELTIYVPDGFGDFMSALSDPAAFMKAANAQKDQMKSLGIEETGVLGLPNAAKRKDDKPPEPPLVFDPITVDSLRQEKGFQKTAKKNQKELDTIKKKHVKERAGVQKTHNAIIDRLVKGKSKDEIKTNPEIRKVIQDQNAQWSEMIERHRKEEWDMLKQQLTDQQEQLRQLMIVTQAGQMKQLEEKLARDVKELNASQVKESVETAKAVAADKNLKTKGDKDRRLREKKQNNIKRFMDEKKVNTGQQLCD
jgi:phosphatidylinositol phospholipase C, beta